MVHTYSPKPHYSEGGSGRANSPRMARLSHQQQQHREQQQQQQQQASSKHTVDLTEHTSRKDGEVSKRGPTPTQHNMMGVLPLSSYGPPQMAMLGPGLGSTVPISPADKELYLKILQNSQLPFGGQLPLQAYYAMEGMNGLSKLQELAQQHPAEPSSKPTKKGRRKRSASKSSAAGSTGPGAKKSAMEAAAQSHPDTGADHGGNKAMVSACLSGSHYYTSSGSLAMALWAADLFVHVCICMYVCVYTTHYMYVYYQPDIHCLLPQSPLTLTLLSHNAHTHTKSQGSFTQECG